MELKESLLILLNLLLIEMFKAIPISIVLGTILNELPINKRRGKIITIVVLVLLFRILFLLITFLLVRYPIAIIAPAGLILVLLYIIVCEFFDKKVIFAAVIFAALFIVLYEFSGKDKFEDMLSAVMFTDNIYIIITGELFGLLALGCFMVCIIKIYNHYPSAKHFGYTIMITEIISMIVKLFE